MRFGELIKNKRKSKEMTQDVLAERLGTTKQTITNWENDRCKPSLNDKEIIELIMRELDISRNEIINTISSLDNDNTGITKINYPFLFDEIIDLNLNKKELELIFLENALLLNDERKINIDDYFSIFETYRNVISTKNKINNVVRYIDSKIIQEIVLKNNLELFDIQNLTENDIYQIMKKYESIFYYLIENKDDLCYFEIKEEGYSCLKGHASDVCLPFGKIILSLKSKIRHRDYHNDDCINLENKDDYSELRNVYALYLLNSYFVAIEDVPENEKEMYNTRLSLYNEDLKIWEEKMEKIRELQGLYGKDAYPDIKMPEEPFCPNKCIVYRLNYKGLLLKEFFEKMKEKNKKEFVDDVRIELASYIGKEISLPGTLVLSENGAYLFKDLYIDGKLIDHLWVYDINEDLCVGITYKLTGVVNIYKKEVDGEYLKNYGIIVKEINSI